MRTFVQFRGGISGELTICIGTSQDGPSPYYGGAVSGNLDG
nr:hypothetical protein [Lactiplantibacillus plantarum]